MSEPTPHAAQRWSPPHVEGAQLARTRAPDGQGSSPSAAALAQQAEASGYAAGAARAQVDANARLAELAARIERLDELLRQLAQPLQLLDAEVEQALLSLALAIGSQLARRALQAEPGHAIALVRACLKQLPLAAREVVVHLHPEDAAIVRGSLAAPAAEGAWRLIEDPTLTRGGCLVESEHSRIDARFESRMHAIVASALGDERASVRADPVGLGNPGDAADAAEPVS